MLLSGLVKKSIYLALEKLLCVFSTLFEALALYFPFEEHLIQNSKQRSHITKYMDLIPYHTDVAKYGTL